MEQKEIGWWKKEFDKTSPLAFGGRKWAKDFISKVEEDARKDERERAKDMILDVIQETDWIEEPKSAFVRLNEALKGLDNNK